MFRQSSIEESTTSFSESSTTLQDPELQKLRQSITQKIVDISQAVPTFEKALQVIGSRDDSTIVRKQIKESLYSIHDKTKATAKAIKRMKSLAKKVSHGDGTAKLALVMLERDFRVHNERYAQVEKAVFKACKQTPLARVPSSDLLSTGYNRNSGASHMEINRSSEAPQMLMVQNRGSLRELELQVKLQVDRDSATARENRLQEIQQLESDIIDIHDMMTQMASMVNDDAEKIDVIDANVESAEIHVKEGVEHLGRASVLVTKRRKWTLAIATCVIVAIVVVIIVITTTMIKT